MPSRGMPLVDNNTTRTNGRFYIRFTIPLHLILPLYLLGQLFPTLPHPLPRCLPVSPPPAPGARCHRCGRSRCPMENGYGLGHLVSVKWLRQMLKDATKVPVPPKDRRVVVSVGHADSTGPGIPKLMQMQDGDSMGAPCYASKTYEQCDARGLNERRPAAARRSPSAACRRGRRERGSASTLASGLTGGSVE